MRILVAGATGYIGSRLVPELLRRGHDVVAASSSVPAPERFAWGDAVDFVQMDATDPAQVAAATDGRRRGLLPRARTVEPELPRPGPGGRRDRARRRRRRAASAGSSTCPGSCPEVPEDELSPHIASRLEVERILLGSTAATLSLRAGVVIGAGSTSFEIVRQTASTLLVQPVPLWMRSRVQPIGVADVLRALADALEGDAVGDVDVGGPDVISYPDLLALYAEVAGLTRVQVPALARAGDGGVAGGRAGLGGAVLDGGRPGAQPAARHGLPARPAGPRTRSTSPTRCRCARRWPRRCSPTVPAVAPPAGRAATRPGCGRRGWSGPSSRPGCPGAPCSARRCTSPTTASAASCALLRDPGLHR